MSLYAKEEFFVSSVPIPYKSEVTQSRPTLRPHGHQAPLSMGFPRQEYWSGLPFLSPGDLHNPALEPTSPALTGRFFTAEPMFTNQVNGEY